MSMNILAILISLAMMLTGAGGEGQPAEAARTLIVHNVNLTYNGETVNLAPALRIGAATDGEKAVYDVGVDLNGETLFPIQLGVDDSGMTLLSKGNDVAVKVSADALSALTEQASAMMQGVTAGNAQSAQLMSYITEEYIPAYAALMQAMSDPDFAAEIQAKGNAIFGEVIDRGEGTPVTVTLNETETALTEYSYTIDSNAMAALVDALYASNDTLKAFSDAMFKLYDLMPAESGLNGVHSFGDVFTKTGMDMKMDVVEQLSDDATIDIMDATLTMDMSAMVQQVSAAQGADATQVPELEPIVIYIHALQNGDEKDADVSCFYEMQGQSLNMNATANTVGTDNVVLQLSMDLAQNGQSIVSMGMGANVAADAASGSKTTVLSYDINMPQAYVGFAGNGIAAADGTGTNTFSVIVNTQGVNVNLSFDMDVVPDAIEDLANGHEAAMTIDDLSGEAMSALSQDPAFQGALMQISCAMMTDAQKLTADESVQQLISLFAAVPTQPVIEGDVYVDDSFGDAEVEDYEVQEVEDDGVLAFNEPQLTWLPEGWTLEQSDVDTAFDSVSMTFTNGAGGMCYVYFYESGSTPTSYVVGENGDITPVEGRQIDVTDFGDGDVSINLLENDVYCNLNIYGANLDMETIGQIVAGIQF